MDNIEMICGFEVKNYPQKPEFLPITQEEFEQMTLEAWCKSGDESRRISAVFRGGPQEWDTLCHDESISVRAAVACHSSERHQLMLVADPEPLLRMRLAVYGTDKVRNALLDRRETNPDVLATIAKYGSTSTRHRLIDVAWENLKALHEIVRYLPASGIDKLLEHPSMEVRIETASHGSRAQCLRVLGMPYSSHEITVVFMRDWLVDRMEELDKVAQAIGQPSIKMQNIGTVKQK